MEVKKSVPINTKARKPRLPEEKRTNFIEDLNCIKILSPLANITQTSQTTNSLSKEKVNTLCNKFSDFLTNQLTLVIIITVAAIQQTTTKKNMVRIPVC